MNHSTDFYKYFNLSTAPKDFKKKQEISQLFTLPKREIPSPHFYDFEANDTHQCDILYLPEDKGFKYCLVVCDIATNKTDAEPVKKLDAGTVLKAIQKIYKRGILAIPHELITDQGNEFKGIFAKYFKDQKVFIKNAIPGRHRQVGLVENKNQILGKVLHMMMYSKESLTGELNREWVDDLKDIIKRMNERYGHNPYTDDELYQKYGDPYDVKQDVLQLGTRVRVALDEPRDITGQKLHGRFRTSDTRWTSEIYKITNIILEPHQPLLYQIDKPTKANERVAFTRQRLQVVATDEQLPPTSILKKKPTTYMIDKIISDKMVKGIKYYRIRWRGYTPKDDTFEPAEHINKKVIDTYEKSKQ